MKKIIIFTTTSFQETTQWERVRINLAHRLAADAVSKSIAIVTVDRNSPEKLLQPLRDLGVIVVKQHDFGEGQGNQTMGVARRQALAAARQFVDSPDDFLVWTEPEKFPIVDDIPHLVDRMEAERSELGMFNRRSLESYPPEQAHAYALPWLASKYFLKHDLDFMFGPVVFREKISEFWSCYSGGLYGDQWDSIHVPKLRAILQGIPFSVITCGYTHPPDQTKAETGIESLFLKRIEQAKSICKAMTDEISRAKI